MAWNIWNAILHDSIMKHWKKSSDQWLSHTILGSRTWKGAHEIDFPFTPLKIIQSYELPPAHITIPSLVYFPILTWFNCFEIVIYPKKWHSLLNAEVFPQEIWFRKFWMLYFTLKTSTIEKIMKEKFLLLSLSKFLKIILCQQLYSSTPSVSQKFVLIYTCYAIFTNKSTCHSWWIHGEI